MMNTHHTFDRLLDLLRDISADEVDDAIAIVRYQRAGSDLRQFPPHLVDVVTALDEEGRGWLESVLCMRAQQAGREDAWMRFAKTCYWDLISSYAPGPRSTSPSGADLPRPH